MKKLFLAGLLSLTCLISVVSADFNVIQNQGFVTDEAGILDQNTKQILEQKLLTLQKSGVAEIAIVTIKSLNDIPIEDYTLKLSRQWGVGDAKKNNGILYLVAPNDRQSRIEVGYGLEGTLTDAESYWINEDAKSYFKENKFSEGILFATDKIITSLDTEYTPTTPKNNSFQNIFKSEGAINLIAFLFFGFVSWIRHILGKTKSIWLGGLLGAIVGLVTGLILTAGILIFGYIIIGLIIGLIIDYIASKIGPGSHGGGFFIGPGGFGGGSSGGFSGFGGGSFGGGGSSSRW